MPSAVRAIGEHVGWLLGSGLERFTNFSNKRPPFFPQTTQLPRHIRWRL